MSKGHHIRYSAEELAWVKANARRPRPAALAEFRERFQRPEISLSNFASLCKRNGWLTGRDGRFPAGHKPHNTGKPHPHKSHTQFRQGNVPANCKPMWDERIGRDGYIEVKVPLRNPYTGHSSRYMHKHRYLWEQVNGPLPKGMALKCLDGNRTNCEPSNWVAVPRAFLPRLAGGRWGRQSYDEAPPEVKPVLLAIAKLEYAARKKRKEKQA